MFAWTSVQAIFLYKMKSTRWACASGELPAMRKREYIKHKVDVRLTRNVVEVFFGGTTRMFILDEEKSP